MKYQDIVLSLFKEAGIKINGNNPYDILVHNKKFYQRVLSKGSLGLGESYMDGWWDCKRLDQLFHKLISAELNQKVKNNLSIMLKVVWSSVIGAGSKSKAFEIGHHHYNIGNNL